MCVGVWIPLWSVLNNIKYKRGKTIINNIFVLQQEKLKNSTLWCSFKCVCDLRHRQHVTTQVNVMCGYMLHWQDVER